MTATAWARAAPDRAAGGRAPITGAMNAKILAGVATGVLLLGVGVVVWPKGLPPLPTQRVAPDTAVATISHGEEVDLRKHLDSQAWTLFEFGADW